MSAIVYYPPALQPALIKYDNPSVFLAGTIEMGNSRNWQEDVITGIGHLPFNVDVFNPRRSDWDSSWMQDITDKNFAEQVNWELDHIDDADIIFVNFEPETKSPITLLELGLMAADPLRAAASIIVCCPPGFWRRGNVQIVCDRFQIALLDTLEEAEEVLWKRLADLVEPV